LRNNNNFRNQNNQIQPDSNNENNHRIRKRKRDNDDTSTNRFKTPESENNETVALICCCLFLIYVIISIGSIMICYGTFHNIPFLTIFGIFDFIIFFLCLALLIFNDKIILFQVYSSLIFYIYLIFIDFVMFLFSFYFSIIDFFSCKNTIEFNQKKIGVLIIFFNTIMGGLGTLIFGLSKICEKNLTIWTRIRDIIFGTIQLTGFILLLYSIFLLPLEKDNYAKIITLLIFGGLSYCFSLYSGISICIELNK